MALSGVGNMVCVNQNMSMASNHQANLQNRMELQTLANMEAFKDKEKQVKEVQKIEETHKINPEEEHEKEKNKEEKGFFEAYEKPSKKKKQKDEKENKNLKKEDTENKIEVPHLDFLI